MASSAFPRYSCALLLILLAAVTPLVLGAPGQRVSIMTTAAECFPATNATNSTAFRANVLALLSKLPSVAAPTGFATLRSTGRSTGRAFARGLCFDGAAPHECQSCLSVAATYLNSSCGANRHLAGIWTDGCFVSYADANATTPGEDALHWYVVSGTDPRGCSASGPDLQWLAGSAQRLAPLAAVSDSMVVTDNATALAWNYAARSTVRVLAQCARDRTAAECYRCLDYSAQAAGSSCWGLDPWLDGVAAAVVGFNCYLRFEVATVPVPLGKMIAMFAKDSPITTALLAAVAAVVVVLVVKGLARLIKEIYYCWMGRKIRAANNNARNPAAVASAAAAAPRAARVELVNVGRAQA